MTIEPFATEDTYTLYLGDCIEVMKTLPESSVDAIVTDPPYSLKFMQAKWDDYSKGEDAGEGYWLAGLTDGEGCFRIQRQKRGTFSCSFQLKLRYDDRKTLERAQKFLGVGTIYDRHDKGSVNPMSAFIVQNKKDCLRVVEVFTRYPLRSKKLRDFIHWSEAVVEWNEMPIGHRWSGKSDWTRLNALKESIDSVRKYHDPPWSGNGFQDWTREWGEEALRIAKPGAHLLAFGGTRTYHRLAAGLEDAGWEIRDCLMWVYSSGFPKGLDISKFIDKELGVKREKVGSKISRIPGGTTYAQDEWTKQHRMTHEVDITAPGSELAKRWYGWNIALKPAYEPVVLARKPLEGTVVQNVIKHGVGGLNIDATRIGDSKPPAKTLPFTSWREMEGRHDRQNPEQTYDPNKGRWPANIIFDEGAASLLDEQTGILKSGLMKGGQKRKKSKGKGGYGDHFPDEATAQDTYADSGGASRFFYIGKASRSERERGLPEVVDEKGNKIRQNHHLTVKPVDLMRYLVRLITPPGGVVLDPFIGSGTTRLAAESEGFYTIGIDSEEEYLQIAVQRRLK